MIGWHHQLDGCEFEQAPGVGDGQGSLACCSPWGCKEWDTTERLNWLSHQGNLTDIMQVKVKVLVAQSCPTLCTPWTAAPQASLFITSSQSLLKLTSIELVMPSNHLILLPSVFPSIRVFHWVGSSHQVAKVLELQLQHQSFHEYSQLIYFWIDWFDLFAVQGTLKRPLATWLSN